MSREVQAEFDALRARSGPWRPIATAPKTKDGEIIDLWYPGIGRVTDQWWIDEDKDWVSLGGTGLNPTYWMPLPPDPPT